MSIHAAILLATVSCLSFSKGYLVPDEGTGLRWGRWGHDSTAQVATALLSDEAKRMINDLLETDHVDIVSVANWADEIRHQKEWAWTTPLHFINTPAWNCSYIRERDCFSMSGVKDLCVDMAIQNYTARLLDTTLEKELRQDALKYVVHFVGDIHQPLHVAFLEDQGGNKQEGAYNGVHSTLHGVWDYGLITDKVKRDFDGNFSGYAQSLVDKIHGEWKDEAVQWTACNAGNQACSQAWAQESIQLACEYAYVEADGKTHIENGFQLGEPYYQRNMPVIDKQLAKCGARMAAVLNAAASKLASLRPESEVERAVDATPISAGNLGVARDCGPGSYWVERCQCCKNIFINYTKDDCGVGEKWAAPCQCCSFNWTAEAEVGEEPVDALEQQQEPPQHLLKWGRDGHTGSAQVAMKLMSDKALEGCKHFLPDVDGDISQIANWADSCKFEPQYAFSGELHYINVPSWQCTYSRAKDCIDDNGVQGACVDGAIQNYTHRLLNTSLSLDERAVALKFLVHFIGDVHQPLHVAFKPDQGGNKIRGSFFDDHSANLHGIWDYGIIEHWEHQQAGGNGTETDFFHLLMAEIDAKWHGDLEQWTQCHTPTDYGICSEEWANETLALACSYAYVAADGKTHIQSGFDLSDPYYDRNLPIVEEQVAKAGVRMAYVLNEVFGVLEF